MAGKTLSELAVEFRGHDGLPDVPALEQLLASMGATLTDLVRGQPVLVLGGGDDRGGEMARFLESLGCGVTAADVDSQVWEQTLWGLALFRGAESDARDPMLMLGQLVQAADYCFLSAHTNRLAPRETLEARFNRAGWEVCACVTSNAPHAEPHAHYILRRIDLFTNGRLLEGWYPAEGPRDGWRWAADLFKVRFETATSGSVRFIYFVPPDRFAATGPFTVGALRDGEVLARQPVDREGVFHVDIPIPVQAQPGAVQKQSTSDLTFWVSPAAAAAGDERVLGVIVRQILFVAAR